MLIRSKQKDYYDYIGHRFGADPNCVYLRGKLPATRVSIPGAHLPTTTQLLDEKKIRNSGNSDISFNFIVAGMMVFPFIVQHFWTAPSPEVPEGLWSWEAHPYDEEKHAGWCWESPIDGPRRPPTYTEDQLKTLIQAVGTPVFHVLEVGVKYKDNTPTTVIELVECVPVLANFGIPKVVPPQQMWQNIYTTLTSVLRRDPDKEPPRTVNNEERIIAAGFDPRSSFRHPINPRKL